MGKIKTISITTETGLKQSKTGLYTFQVYTYPERTALGISAKFNKTQMSKTGNDDTIKSVRCTYTLTLTPHQTAEIIIRNMRTVNGRLPDLAFDPAIIEVIVRISPTETNKLVIKGRDDFGLLIVEGGVIAETNVSDETLQRLWSISGQCIRGSVSLGGRKIFA